MGTMYVIDHAPLYLPTNLDLCPKMTVWKIFLLLEQATLADGNIETHININTVNNPRPDCSVSVWLNVTREYKLQKNML